MLNAAVFIAGGILMALEMVGSRVLAPYFGNSIYVWGSLISVVLAALTAGYFIGGRLADRWPRADVMGWLIAIPGAFTAVMPFWAGSLNVALVAAGLDVRAGSLIAALLLFFIPGIFLGTVSPYAVRLAARQVETVGRTAGLLYAVSTAGSIAGTLFTAFFLVGWMGVRLILHSLGLALVVLGLAVVVWALRSAPAWQGPPAGVRERRAGARTAAAVRRRSPLWRPVLWGVVLLAATVSALLVGQRERGWVGLAQERAQVVYEHDSAYHHILVVDEPNGERHLKFDDSWQSGMDRQQPDRLIYAYTRYFHLPMALLTQPRRVLFVGLGGGSVPKSFLKQYPQLVMDAAELDPEVIQVARRWFAVPDDPRLHLVAQDGRMFVRGAPAGTYDAVFLDAYFAHSIPFHLATEEFMREVGAVLKPDGVVVSNIIGALGGARSQLFRSMLKTIQKVFPTAYVFAVEPWSGSVTDTIVRNIIVVGSRQSAVAPQALRAQVEAAEAAGRLPTGTAALMRSLVAEPIPTADVPTLTDDYAPVDLLIRV